ncbi:MAG: phosphoenolpyruvate synthase [Chloroflexota bacterium]
MKTATTLPFENIRAADLPLVGGKGANLGEMTHAGFPIPAGFCVTTAAFAQFIAACPQADALYAELDTVTTNDIDTARRVGQHVRETLLTVPMPPVIATEIRTAWQHIGTDEAYAVRSSATAEDLPDASFAGQQDTYLNVIGEDALLDAVRRCWVSLFTDRAILYRIQNNFSHHEVQLSVVVQQMVMSETSGILFTADPLTGHRHTATIDASYGLGEALVSGLVSPDNYRIDKRDMTIIERQIADKQIAIYPEKTGGVRQVDLADAQRTQTVLTDQQIIALAKLGTRIEAHYGTPQDIEWAIVGEQLYLLQARPITSLYPIETLQSPDDSLHIFFSMGHQQMMTDMMSPLGLSSMRALFPVGRAEGELESSLMRVSGGRLYVDLTQALRHPILHRVIFAVLSQFDALAPDMMRLAMQRPEFKRPHRLSLSFSKLRGAVRIMGRVQYALWREDLTGFVHQANDVLAEAVAGIQHRLDQAPTNDAKLQVALETLHSFFQVPLFWIPRLMAGIIADRLVQRIARNWVSPKTVEAYNLGLPGNVVTEMNMAVGDLADVARQSPQLRALFAELGNDSQAWLAKAAQVEDSDDFFAAWEAFMTAYGARGSAEIDIYPHRWYEEPLPLLQVIASYLQKEAGSHRRQHERLVEGRKTAVNELITHAQRGIYGRLRGRLLRRLIHVAHEGSVLREHHKFYGVQGIRVIKETIKQVAAQLVEQGQLAQPDDVWFLSWPELLALTRGKRSNVGALIAKRRADLQHYANLTPPAVLTSDGETPAVKYHVADAPEGALVGNPVSAGVVEGTVHVIHDPHTESLSPGEILVASFTDPGWTPLFINAGGLIMEVGGAMTHGSVVAREYGIPAIVGVREATTGLQTGQRVRVDGNRGVIEILR